MPRSLNTPNRARRFVLALIAVAAAGAILVRTGIPPLWVPAVHRAVTTTINARKIPGLSLAVLTRGKVRWSSGYGLADVENHVPARANTVYHWASVSRPVIALAALQLAERGRLDLDAPIQTYVSEFPVQPAPVTSRQLLSTCNTDNPLGTVVAAAAGEPLPDYLRARIFRPAAMTSARLDDRAAIISRRARGYLRTAAGKLQNATPPDSSDPSLCGTAEDAVKFAAALHQGALIPRPRVDLLLNPRAVEGETETTGLGWNLTRRDGHREVWQASRSRQGSTILYTLPDREFAVAVLVNLEGVELLDLARAIADAVSP